MKKNITQKSKCYIEIQYISIIVASIWTSVEYKRNGVAIASSNDGASLEGLGTEKHVQFHLNGPIESLIRNAKPDNIEIYIIDSHDVEMQSFNSEISMLIHSIDYIAMPCIVNFYERNIVEAKKKFGKLYEKWPNSWRMGWIVRNAFSHNNAIYYKDIKTPETNWRNVIISPKNQDLQLSKKLSVADIIILLIDMSDDLDNKTTP